MQASEPDRDAAYLFQLAASLAKQRSNVLPFGCICGERLLAVVHYLQGTCLPCQCNGRHYRSIYLSARFARDQTAQVAQNQT